MKLSRFPALFKWEEFDEGEKGVGYSDSTKGNKKGVDGVGFRCGNS